MNQKHIQIRDPFVVADQAQRCYYLFGTTDKDCWKGPGTGFDCYRSEDLIDWEGPIPAFRPPPGFWGTHNFWAPEVHHYQGRYYMFATFAGERVFRGTQILVSDLISGPYVPLTDGPITPGNWQCLDGTLHIDGKGEPWIVFCHEWMQVHDGAMYAMRLSHDLTRAAAPPVFLFNASQAPWAYRSGWPGPGQPSQFPAYLSGPEVAASYPFPIHVTDGPFLHRKKDGMLLMLWSTLGEEGYTMGLAHSESGEVSGPWIQLAEPLWTQDGGHGMIFRTFEGRLFIAIHHPNQTPLERPLFVEIEETASGIRFKNQASREHADMPK
jgi:arabinan endo-1,5-alpha-L-arabinosidase